MIFRKLAAMDFGSNAIRGLIAEYSPMGLKIMKKYRYPVRLGGEVFHEGSISESKIKQLIEVIQAFKKQCFKLGIDEIKAVGTSALREAKNRIYVVERLQNETGLKLKILTGQEEAFLIWFGLKNEIHLENHEALLMDVGGGSVEFTFHRYQRVLSHSSMPFGTLRLLEELNRRSLKESDWPYLIRDFCQEQFKYFYKTLKRPRPEFLIGTGGNLSVLYELVTQFFGQAHPECPMANRDQIHSVLRRLQKYNLKQRQKIFSLRRDRADVIIPATYLVLLIMDLTACYQILLPRIGLREGLLWALVNNKLRIS